MAVPVSELLVLAEAGGVPQGSPPHQAGEDRGTPRPGGTRRDGGVETPAPEDAPSREEADRRVQADEGRGQEVHPTRGS